MSILDALMGTNDFQAHAPKLDTAPGQAAIRGQAQLGGDQALAQAYSLAASGRGGGGSSALAFREAQRRGSEATMNLQGQAVAQQQALQQSALQQQAQAEMQAQQINAQIAQENAKGMSKLVGLGMMGAGMAFGGPMGAAVAGGAAQGMTSDYRQKEMLSDFTAKEGPGTYIPQPVRVGVDQSAFSTPVVNQQLEQNRARAFEGEQAGMAAAYDQGPSAVQVLGVSPEQAAEAAQMRDSGELHDLANVQRQSAGLATAEHEQAQKLDALRGAAGALMNPQPATPIQMRRGEAPGFYLAQPSQPAPMVSDARAKERAYAEGVVVGASRSPMTPGYFTPRPSPMAPGYPPRRAPMVSDFRQKEDLDPVQPTLYRYNPQSSYRQALEAAQRTFATTLEDKRAPRMGIVAQDLQHSPAFAPSVVQKDDGQLAVDKDRALSAALAELGGLHQRVKRLEGGKHGA